MAFALSLLSEIRRTFVGNAASVRDFRVQMRGAKPIWVFTIFVFCLGLFGAFMYSETLGHGSSLARMQDQLRSFYMAVTGMLGGAICLIAPGLTATTIVAEKQRQSLDLILCAPVKPQYLLVGKMLGSYRYIWMLLFLALPIVAMSVVLGGATWVDVFGTFLLLSFDALIFTSLALLISSLAGKAPSAVFWSLVCVGIYVAVTTSIGAASSFSMFMGHSNHQPFTVALSPFMASVAASTTTEILGHDVPNIVLAGLFTLLVTRQFIISAATYLSPLDTKLVANARISGLVLMFLIAMLVGSSVGGTASMVGSGMSGSTSVYAGKSGGINFLWVCLCTYGWLLFTMPLLTCYGPDMSRRFWPNGQFRLRHLFDGTPGGALPFALVLFALITAGVFLGLRLTINVSLPSNVWTGILWGAGMLTFDWSLGQYVSSCCTSLRTARVFHIVGLVCFFALLPVMLIVLQVPPPGNFELPTRLTPLWYASPFTVLSEAGYGNAATVGIILLVLAFMISLAANRRLAPKLRMPV